MVLTKGISEYPKPGHLVRRETYDQEYAAIIKKEGVPFFPKAISKDLIAAAVVIFGILFCAALFGPKMPNGIADPTQIDTVPRPDFYFLWIFAVAALLPDYTETFILLAGGPVILLILFGLPFINNTGEKSWRRRPVAVITVILCYVVLGVLTYLGQTSPWSPEMDAWTSVNTEKSRVLGRSPLELQGLVLLQNKQCRNCHAIDGIGGHRGPDLADVGSRLTSDQLVRQIIQGGGNMPAYGNKVSPYDVDALVAYLVSLRQPGVPPARDSAVPGVPPKETASVPKNPPGES
jgi:ubiquinol-cytochrome c reductase cytochrome b subunit